MSIHCFSEAMSSFDALFSFYPQSFPASGTFPMSQLFMPDDQNIGASASAKFNDYSGLKIDWFNFLAVQGTLRSLLQHHSSKASILWCSTFFTVQFSQLYVTIRKTITLTIQTFVSRGMSAFQHTV